MDPSKIPAGCMRRMSDAFGLLFDPVRRRIAVASGW